MSDMTLDAANKVLLRAGLHEMEVAFIEPGTRRTLALRLAEVERERDAALARLRELEAGIPAVRELRDAAVALADMVEEDAKEDVAGILGQRALQYEEAMRYAAAELRHAYRDRVINRNLVARAIEALERAMLPESYNG